MPTLDALSLLISRRLLNQNSLFCIYLSITLTLTFSFCCLHHTTHSHSQLGYRTGASRGSEHVHHGAPSFLSWRGIVFDRAHSVVLCSTRMTHGVEGLITPSSADTHTHTDCYTLLRLTRSKAISLSLSQLRYIVYLLSIHSSVSLSITLTLALALTLSSPRVGWIVIFVFGNSAVGVFRALR